MADEGENSQNSNMSNSTEPDKELKCSRSLEDFVTQQYEEQKSDGKITGSPEIDNDRMSNFFERALAESQRMSAEVDKSYAKIEELHQDLGARNFASWRSEHASEVLLPEQIRAVELATHYAPERP